MFYKQISSIYTIKNMKDEARGSKSSAEDIVGKSVQTDAIKSDRESTTRRSSEPMAMSFTVKSVKHGSRVRQQPEKQQEIEIQEQVKEQKQNSQRSGGAGEQNGDTEKLLSVQIPAAAQQRRGGSRQYNTQQSCRPSTLVSNIQSQLRQLQLNSREASGSQLSMRPMVSRIGITKRIDSHTRTIQRKKAFTNITSDRPASFQAYDERTGVSLGSPRYNNATSDLKSIDTHVPAVTNCARTDRCADRLSRQAQGQNKYRQTLAQPERELATKIISIQDLPNGIQGASTKATVKSKFGTQPKGRIRNFKASTNIHFQTQNQLGVFGQTLRQIEEKMTKEEKKKVTVTNFEEQDLQDSYFQKELHDFHQQNIEEFNQSSLRRNNINQVEGRYSTAHRETLTREDYLRKKNTAARGSISAEKEVALKDMTDTLLFQLDVERPLGPAYSTLSLPFGRKEEGSGTKTPDMAASSRSYLGFFDNGLTPLRQRLYNDSPVIDITKQRALNDSTKQQKSHTQSREITEEQPTFRSKEQRLVKQQIIKVVGKINKGDKRNIAIKCMENFQQNLASDENTIITIYPKEVEIESDENKIQTPSIANAKPSIKSQRSIELQKSRAQTQSKNKSEITGSRLLTYEIKAQNRNLSLKELVSRANNEQVFLYEQSQSIMKSKLRQKMMINGVHRMFEKQSAIVPKQMAKEYRGSRSNQEDKKFWITTQSIVKQRDLKHTHTQQHQTQLNIGANPQIPLKRREKERKESGVAGDRLNQTTKMVPAGRSSSAMFGDLGKTSSCETMRPIVNFSSTRIANAGSYERHELLKKSGFPLQKAIQNNIIMKSFHKSQRSKLKSAFDLDLKRNINLPQPQLEVQPDSFESQAASLAQKELASESAATTGNIDVEDAPAEPDQPSVLQQYSRKQQNVLERLELLEKLRTSAEQWSIEKKPRKAEKKAHSFMNFVSLPSSLTKDKYYQTLLVNKNTFGQEKIVPNILDLIKIPDTNDLSFEQLALVQNFFNNHIYTDLLNNILQDLANNKVHSSIITFIKYLPLNVEFVEKIMKHSKVLGFLRPYNTKKRPSQMYFIHAGCVDVFDAQSKRVVTTLGKGQVFKMDSQIDLRRKYRARKENDEPVMVLKEEHENFPFIFLNKLALIQFDIGDLAKVFIDQIKCNLDENKQCLLGFSIFYCLGREKLSYLAQRALRAEYADEEVILEEGTLPMDKVYLILKGQVKVSCSSNLLGTKGSLNARELVLGPGEYFGLKEMLYEYGQRGGFPALKRYTADCSSGMPPTVMAIHAYDFLKVVPEDEVAKLMIQHDVASLAELEKAETYQRAFQKLSNNRLRHELGFSRGTTASQHPREYKITLKSQSMNKQ